MSDIYLFTTEVNQSVLHQGISIPITVQEQLFRNISHSLVHGDKIPIKINIENKHFDAELKNQKFDVDKYSNRKDIVQIRYNTSNPIIHVLRNIFPSTHVKVNHFLATRDNKKTRLAIPETEKEFIQVFIDSDSKEFRFICIPLSNGQVEEDSSYASLLDRKIKSYMKSDDYIRDLGREKVVSSLRSEFTESFPISSFDQLTLKKYCLGFDDSSKESFCYWIEERLNDLGNIHGATSAKFGVYYGCKGEDHENKLRWTSWTNKSFDTIKDALIDLCTAGAVKDLHSIASSKLSPMFRGKILSCYFPDKYLNIYSYEYVKYYLKMLGVFEYPALEEAQQLLINIKNSNVTSQKWSNLLFCFFLGYAFPEAKSKTSEELRAETPVIIGKEMTAITSSVQYEKITHASKSTDKKSDYKPDYEKAERLKRNLGNEGENAVVNYEKKRLADAGRQDLADKVVWISRKSDAYGFDVISYDETAETEKHIEVKTSSSNGCTVGFYLTDNEYQNLLNDPFFCIYYVSKVNNKPSLYIVDHSQLKERFSELSHPVLYKVEFKASDL